VSGFYIGHPDAVCFSVGKIGEDQLHDMAQRRGMDEKVLERLLAPNLRRTCDAMNEIAASA